jgi:hypothetical protein
MSLSLNHFTGNYNAVGILVSHINEITEFPREGTCSGGGAAQGIEAVSFCPVIGGGQKIQA